MSIGALRLATNAGVKTDDGLRGFLALTAAAVFSISQSRVTLLSQMCLVSFKQVFGLKQHESFQAVKNSKMWSFLSCQGQMQNLLSFAFPRFYLISPAVQIMKVWILTGAITIIMSG